MKRYFLGALVGAVAMVSACSVKVADVSVLDIKPPQALVPTQPLTPQVRKEPPQVETRQVGKHRIEFHTQAVPKPDAPMIKLGARPVKPATVADTDHRLAGQKNKKVFHTPEKFYCPVQQRGGKIIEGWLEPGTQLFTELEKDLPDRKIWRVTDVVRCGNPPAYPTWVVEVFPQIETTIREREVVEQPILVRDPGPRYFYGPTVGVWWGWGGGGYYRHRSNVHIRRHHDVHIRRHHYRR